MQNHLALPHPPAPVATGGRLISFGSLDFALLADSPLSVRVAWEGRGGWRGEQKKSQGAGMRWCPRAPANPGLARAPAPPSRRPGALGLWLWWVHACVRTPGERGGAGHPTSIGPLCEGERAPPLPPPPRPRPRWAVSTLQENSTPPPALTPDPAPLPRPPPLPFQDLGSSRHHGGSGLTPRSGSGAGDVGDRPHRRSRLGNAVS